MKKLLIIFLAIVSNSCDKSDDTPQAPISQLPPATTTGANTFGFLLNGEPVVVRNTSNQVAIYQNGLMQISAEFDIENTDKGLSMWIERPIVSGTWYDFNSNVMNTAYYRDIQSSCFLYQTTDPSSGRIIFDLIDEQRFIVSGKFEFTAVINEGQCSETVSITSGRFDMQYIP